MRKKKLKEQVVEVLDELVLTAKYLTSEESTIKPTPHLPFLKALKNRIEKIEERTPDQDKRSISFAIDLFFKEHQGPTTFFSRENIGQGRTYRAIQSLLAIINNPRNVDILSPGRTEDMILMGLNITDYCQFYGVEKKQLERYFRSNENAGSASSQAEDLTPHL